MDVDEQFDRAVSIVQSLPKSGPIQTEYEEKLAMYGLFKQATVGDVNSVRPGIWDMLNRAKWDAWQQHGGTPQREAKRLYVEALSRILMKHSDKRFARDLLQSLDAGKQESTRQPLAISASFVKTPSESTSSSDLSAADDDDDDIGVAHPAANLIPYPPHLQPSLRGEPIPQGLTSEEELSDRGGHRYRPPPNPEPQIRPSSAISSHQQYKTPMITATPPVLPPTIGTLAIPETSSYRQPQMQPMPMYSTPSAFDRGDGRFSSIPLYMSGPSTHPAGETGVYPPGSFPPMGPSSHRTTPHTFERLIENIQGHIATLSERIDRLEDVQRISNHSERTQTRNDSTRGGSLPVDIRLWDTSNMGLWSIIFKPLARMLISMSSMVEFLLGPTYAHGPAHPGLTHPSPVLVIVRRLTLDATFIISFYALVRYVIRRSGRRREIRAAFRDILLALLG